MDAQQNQRQGFQLILDDQAFRLQDRYCLCSSRHINVDHSAFAAPGERFHLFHLISFQNEPDLTMKLSLLVVVLGVVPSLTSPVPIAEPEVSVVEPGLLFKRQSAARKCGGSLI